MSKYSCANAARPRRWLWRGLVLGVGCLALFCVISISTRAQFSGAEITNFRHIPGYYEPPHEKQKKALLEGSRAQPLPNAQIRVTDGKLHSFYPTGEPELNVTVPEAIYHQRTGIMNSEGHLRVETGDGGFSIEGDGFQWQTNLVLYISNRVHTVVLPELLSAKSAHSRPVGPVSSLDVISDRFRYTGDSGLAVYDDRVRVAGTNFWLTSGHLTLKVPRKELHLETIRAEHNVVLDYTNVDETIHATGGQALYAVPTGQLRVTDHPAWRTALRQGGGEEVFIDYTNKIFRTTGKAWLEMTTQGKNGGGLLPQIDLLATNAHPSHTQVVDIRSDDYEFRTNFAVFDRHVHLTQRVGAEPKGSLDCGLLTVSFVGTNQVQRMVAEQDVVLRQEDKAFTSGKAVYTPTNALLELTENPTWHAGPREGKGDHMFINVTNAEMIVRGNASMRVPAGEVTPSALMQLGGTNSKPQVVPTAAHPSALDPRSTNFADIYAEEYTLKRIGDHLVSYFRGGVYITHTNMNLICATMTVTAPVEANKGETRMVADQDVQFELSDTRGQHHQGKGDKVVYTHSVTNGTTNDIVVLTGNPALLRTTNNATARNSSFTLDLGRGTISGSGQYVFSGTGPAIDTNRFKLPTRR